MKNTTLIFSFMLFVSVLFAQNQTVVKGNVTSAKGNDPLVAATIMIQGTSFGTITDDQGKYQLKIPNNISRNITLVASYTGYENSTVALLVAGTTMLQDFSLEEGAMLGDIIVSANKKSEKAQEVAMSISVLTAKELQRTGATQFRDYASSIPNLAFGTQGGGGAFNDGRTSNQISLRGITGANTTAMYVDETPLPANIDPRLVDIARIEVLRGPQGSLYGSSTMGGAVKVVTNQPNAAQKEGAAMLTLAQVHEGTYDYGTNAIINLPLVKNKLALRATGFYDQQTGVYDRIANQGVNILNKETLNATITGDPLTIPTDNCTTCAPTNKENVDAKSNYGFQASLGFFPSKNISIIPKVMFQNQTGNGYDFADISTKNFKQYRSSSVDEHFSDKWGHYSLLANIGLGNGKLISSTSYIDRTYKEQEDEGQFLSTIILNHPDSTKNFWAGVITRDGHFKKFVQELRYQSEFKGKFNMTVGLYYGNENLVETGNSLKKGFISYLAAPVELEKLQWFDMDNDQKVKETALFGELYYDLTSKLRATVGARYFSANSKRTFSAIGAPYDFDEATVNQNITESGFNPKFNLTYKLDANKLVYATISKGYRLGGVNAPLPVVWCAEAIKLLGGQPPLQYGADYLWNYEAGLKSLLANGKIIFNAAAFYNSWQNLQQRRFFPDCGLGFISNVGSASSKGLEVEVNAEASKALNVGFGFGLLDAKIKETGVGLDAKVGDRILFTPQLTANVTAQYTKQLGGSKQFFIRANAQHVGERYSSFSYKTDAARVLAAYTLINARIGYVTKRYEIDLFANNLTGEQANFGDVTSLAAETPGRPRYMTNRPRTIGVMLKGYF